MLKLKEELGYLEGDIIRLRAEIARLTREKEENDNCRLRLKEWRMADPNKYDVDCISYYILSDIKRVVRITDNKVAVLYGELLPEDEIAKVPLKDRTDIAVEMIRNNKEREGWHFLHNVHIEWIPRGERYHVHCVEVEGEPLRYDIVREREFEVAL